MPSLAKCPTYKGLPIPYVQFIRSDGTPDFKVVDDEKRWECVERHICGLCGDPLGYWIAFIGGPLCVENRAYLEPPMHVECVQEAMKICPYLCKGKEFVDHVKPDPDSDKTLYMHDEISPDRPERMGIYVARTYTVETRRGQKIVAPGKPARIEWYDEQGDLLEVER